jgi:hypothetical protein
MHIQCTQILDNGVTVNHHVARSSNFDLSTNEITIVVYSYIDATAALTYDPVTTQIVNVPYDSEAISNLLISLDGNLTTAIYSALITHKFNNGQIIND